MQGQRILTRDLLYSAIRDAVVSGELGPGIRVTEMQLAQLYGMSRTPLREAIARLESEQLMTRMPNGALVIAPLDMDQLEEIYDIQERVEGLVIGSLARKKNKEVIAELDAIIRKETALFDVSDFLSACEQNRNFHQVLWLQSNRPQAMAILEGFVSLIERYERLAPISNDIRSQRKTMEREHTLMRNAIAEGDPVWAELALKTHVRNMKKFLLTTYRNGSERRPSP